MRKLLLGNEALALGAIDAGLSGVYAYPGTPSTEITTYIQNSRTAKELGIHSGWSINEKTAMEAALGMSYAGKRAMVVMKHVGLNVAADIFMNATLLAQSFDNFRFRHTNEICIKGQSQFRQYIQICTNTDQGGSGASQNPIGQDHAPDPSRHRQRRGDQAGYLHPGRPDHRGQNPNLRDCVRGR